jgi:Flp pilus assembly protein TadD
MVAGELGHADILERDLGAILAADPDNASALNALGYTLADRGERLDEAHAMIERALTLRPDDPAILDSMGWVLFRLGRPAEALPWLRRALELADDGEIAAHLGEVLWNLGERSEARRVWRRAQEQTPDNKHLQRTLERHGL